MPTFSDMTQFLGGQYFGRPYLVDIDLSSKTIVVTGANTGLGYECAKHLANMGVSTLILGVRSIPKGEAARDAILAQLPHQKHTDIQVWPVDLESYASVRAFCKRVREQLSRLHGFIANAGIETNQFGVAEGLEKTLTINVVSTALMALEVLPKLRETAETGGNGADHTVLSLVGSMIHVFGPDRQLRCEGKDLLRELSDEATADMGSRYPLSKLILHLWFCELARRVGAATEKTDRGKVVVNLVNPGWCATELHRYNGEPLMQRFMALIFRWTAEEGSRTLVHGVTAGQETHGQYLSECQVKPQSAYMRSQRASEDGSVVWDQIMQALEQISPGISAGYT